MCGLPVIAFLLVLVTSSIVEALRGVVNDGNRCYKAATFQVLANLPSIYQETISKFPTTKEHARQATSAVIAQLRSPPEKSKTPLVLSTDFLPALLEDLKLPGRPPMELGARDEAQTFYTWLMGWGLPKEASESFNTQVRLTKSYNGISYKEEILNRRVMHVHLDRKSKDRTLEKMIMGDNGVYIKEAIIEQPENASKTLMRKLKEAAVTFGKKYKIKETYGLQNSPKILSILVVKNWARASHARYALNFSETMNAGGKKYTLVGAIMYPGGHYYTLTREAGTGAWYELNNSNVAKQSLQYLKDNASQIFMLFYARQDEYDSWVNDPNKFLPAWPTELSNYVAKLEGEEGQKINSPNNKGGHKADGKEEEEDEKNEKKINEDKVKDNKPPIVGSAKKPAASTTGSISFQTFWKDNQEWIILVGVAVLMLGLTLTAYKVARRRRQQQAYL